MFSRLRRITNKVVAVAAPIGKYIQSAGSALFSSTTTMLYFMHEDLNESEDSAVQNPYILGADGMAIIANTIVTRRTRVPAMRRQIARRNQMEFSEEKTEAKIENISCAVGTTAKTTSFLAKAASRSSAMWSALNTVFFSLKLMEFFHVILFSHLLKLLDSDKEDFPYQAFLWTSVLTIAGSNLLSYISLNMDKADKSADALAEKIKTCDFKWDRYVLLTLFIVALNTVPTFMFSNVTTEKSLRKLPGFKDLPKDSLLISVPVNISTVSALLTGMLSSNQQIYHWLTSKHSLKIKAHDPVNIANVYESFCYGTTAAVSMLIKMSAKDPSTDIYSPEAYLPAFFFGALAGWVGYIFSTESYRDTLIIEQRARRADLARTIGLNHSLLNADIQGIEVEVPEIELQSLIVIPPPRKNYNPTHFKSSPLTESLLSDDEKVTHSFLT